MVSCPIELPRQGQGHLSHVRVTIQPRAFWQVCSTGFATRSQVLAAHCPQFASAQLRAAGLSYSAACNRLIPEPDATAAS